MGVYLLELLPFFRETKPAKPTQFTPKTDPPVTEKKRDRNLKLLSRFLLRSFSPFFFWGGGGGGGGANLEICVTNQKRIRRQSRRFQQNRRTSDFGLRTSGPPRQQVRDLLLTEEAFSDADDPGAVPQQLRAINKK